MRVVEARGLAQRFGSLEALHSLDLDLEAGERLAVLGDNGAGKTTLLRLLATAARPAAGELCLFGLDGLRDRARLRSRIGFLAHQPGLYPALTAAENLRFFAALYGADKEGVEPLLAHAGLAGDERLVGELSRGLQQRLALVRSVLHDPQLWILDEPDAGLDAGGGALLERLAEGRTLVLATHDRALARRLCGRSLTLREGRAEAVPEAALRIVR